MSDRDDLINEALRQLADVSFTLAGWEGYLRQALSSELSDDDRAGCTINANASAKKLLGMIGSIQAAACFTQHAAVHDNLPPNLLEAVDGT